MAKHKLPSGCTPWPRNGSGFVGFTCRGATEPKMLLWLRHREAGLKSSLVALLALADAPPPAASTMASKPSIISTMTWSVDMLTDTIETDGGWWLVNGGW